MYLLNYYLFLCIIVINNAHILRKYKCINYFIKYLFI